MQETVTDMRFKLIIFFEDTVNNLKEKTLTKIRVFRKIISNFSTNNFTMKVDFEERMLPIEKTFSV